MRVKVINFFTQAYTCAAAELYDSCKIYNLDAYICRLDEFPSWAHGVCHKPQFILDSMKAFPEYDGYLWTDADSVFKRQPDFEVFVDCHFSAHKFKRSPAHEEEILTGTFWLANTPTLRSMVKEWAENTERYIRTFTPEQHSLKEVLPRWGSQILFKNMDPEWVWIPDTMPEIYGKRNPIVHHHQMSRELRYTKKL